jgi:putative ABC transport system substrate-binding protein
MSAQLKRRSFITLVGGAAAWPLAARAQQVSLARVGVLLADSEDQGMQARLEGLRQGLERLGWSHGRNIRVVYRFGEGKPDRLQPLAKELVAMRPDLIVAQTPPVVVAVLKETSVVPIVFVDVSDPIGAGFIANLARPGGTSPA